LDEEGWVRIGDHETADWGMRKFRFEYADGAYEVFVETESQELLEIRFDDQVERWIINRKHQRDGIFMMCGCADTVPELMSEICWFEFVMSDKPEMLLWGEGRLYRIDYGVEITT
jgi:hypothetical protein